MGVREAVRGGGARLPVSKHWEASRGGRAPMRTATIPIPKATNKSEDLSGGSRDA
jgi:hypothetical protein